MAIAPGETNESFIREVDENLRRDNAEVFLKKNGGWLIGLAVLLLAATAALIYWRNHQTETAAQNSEKLNAVMGDIGAGKLDSAGQLADIAKDGNDADRATAMLTQAAVAVQKGDRTGAAALYAKVAADTGLPDAWRNAALIRGTQLEFDTIKPDDVVNRLQNLAVPGNAWFGSAGEMTGMALIKQNRRAEAARIFASVGADRTVPESLRVRAEQLGRTLAAPAAPATASPAPAPQP